MKVINEYLNEGLFIPAILGVAAITAYKRFFSDAAKQCNHQYGDKKSECMLKYKIKIAGSVLNGLKKKNANRETVLNWQNKLKKYQLKLVRLRKRVRLKQQYQAARIAKGGGK